MSTVSGSRTMPHNEGEIDFSLIFHQLWEKKWLIIGVTLFTFSLGILYIIRQVPLYQADILLQIDEHRSSNTSIGGLSKKLDLTPSYENTAATHSALIQSRFILEPVINSLGLDIKAVPDQSFLKRFIFPSTDNKITIAIFDTEELHKPFKLVFDKINHVILYDQEKNLVLQGKIGALLSSADRKIRLKVKSIQAPVKSKFSLTKQSDLEVTHALLNRLKIKNLGDGDETGIFQISLKGSDPNEMIRTLNAIGKKAQLKDIEKKSLEASKALAFLYQQLPLAKASLDQAETDLNRYRATSGKIDIKLQSQSFLAQLEELDKQLGTLRINKIDMENRYTTAHPFLIALIHQTKALEKKRAQLEQYLKSLPSSDQIAVNLMRDVEVKNSLYLILLNKVQELEFVKAGTISNVRILSYAKQPEEPLPTHTRLIYGGSIILGLALSFMIIFVRKFLFSLVDDPHWGERHLNLVNLAIIPYCKEQTTNTRKFNTHTLDSLPLLAHSSPRNLAIESLRSLRTNLQVTLYSASNNIISILGISSGVGKTFIASNLAWLLAVGGKRVLLIDGDLRRGVLHKNFNLQPKPGLVDLLTKRVTAEQILKKTEHPNLTVITRGSYIADSSELLMSKDFKDFIHSSAQQFDIVVIDTAPILLVTDGVLIAGLSGTNYLVIGANAHHPTEIVMVMKRLANAGVEVHGSIFNFFKTGAKSNFHSKYGGYYEDEELTVESIE